MSRYIRAASDEIVWFVDRDDRLQNIPVIGYDCSADPPIVITAAQKFYSGDRFAIAFEMKFLVMPERRVTRVFREMEASLFCRVFVA
jgi:hypothetical protein